MTIVKYTLFMPVDKQNMLAHDMLSYLSALNVQFLAFGTYAPEPIIHDMDNDIDYKGQSGFDEFKKIHPLIQPASKDYSHKIINQTNMIIKGLNYNWRPVVRKYSDGYGGEIVDSSAEFDSAFVGMKYYVDKDKPNKICIRIEEHIPQGEGNQWFYDIFYDNGTMQRVFNPNEVFYEKGV